MLDGGLSPRAAPPSPNRLVSKGRPRARGPVGGRAPRRMAARTGALPLAPPPPAGAVVHRGGASGVSLGAPPVDA